MQDRELKLADTKKRAEDSKNEKTVKAAPEVSISRGTFNF